MHRQGTTPARAYTSSEIERRWERRTFEELQSGQVSEPVFDDAHLRQNKQKDRGDKERIRVSKRYNVRRGDHG